MEPENYKYQDVFDAEVDRLKEWLTDFDMELSVLTYPDYSSRKLDLPNGSAGVRDGDRTAEDGSFEDCKVVIIECPPPCNLVDLSVFLHEVGHVYHHHSFDAETREAVYWPSHWYRISDEQAESVLERERVATDYALNRMKELGLGTEWARRVLRKCYNTYVQSYKPKALDNTVTVKYSVSIGKQMLGATALWLILTTMQ
jgi:hypothetical protein